MRIYLFAVFLALTTGFTSMGAERITHPILRIFPGYVTKVSCEGKLLVSSIGNDLLVRLEALPVTLGCAVLLKPNSKSGRTNLVLETTAGSIQVPVEVRSGLPDGSDLKVLLRGDHS